MGGDAEAEQNRCLSALKLQKVYKEALFKKISPVQSTETKVSICKTQRLSSGLVLLSLLSLLSFLMASSTSRSDVKVAVKVMPENGCTNCITIFPEDPTMLQIQKEVFKFDYIYTSESSMMDSLEPIVNAIFEGQNATIMAYGQNASGKTHTMGMVGVGFECMENSNSVISHVIDSIFSKLDSTKEEFLFHVHFIEIYNEQVRNLLNNKAQVKEKLDGGMKANTNVLFALANQKKNTKTYVPYRDSKLTKLLQASSGVSLALLPS